MRPTVHALFDDATWTLTYVVWDPETGDAAIVDPVLDFDPLRVRVSTESAQRLADFVTERGLTVHWILDTHAHADHLSGQAALKDLLGAKTAISEGITGVQAAFKRLLDLPADFPTDGSQWDALVADGDVLQAGSLQIHAIATPGHTPACTTYRVGDAIFTGDTMFMPDFGTGRCDFPGGSAEALYDSVQKLYALPDDTRVFVGHDYQPGGRELQYETSIGDSKERNKQLRANTKKADFVRWRAERDATLKPPRLIFQSLQVNAAAGALPPADAAGRRYLKLPMNVL